MPEGGSDAGESGQAGSAEGGSRSDECPQPTHLGSRSEFSVALCGCVADSWGSDMVCFPLPSNRESCDDAYTRECVLSRYTCGLVTRGDEIVCTGAAPLGDAGVACCYLMHGECRYPVG